MVTITASLTAKEIADAVGIFENLAKVLVQRMFNMNSYREFFSNYDFYIQPADVNGRQLYASDGKFLIGLKPGETDGTKAALLALFVKAAPSHIDMKGYAPKP